MYFLSVLFAETVAAVECGVVQASTERRHETRRTMAQGLMFSPNESRVMEFDT